MKWKHFSRYWPFVREAFRFYLICAWIKQLSKQSCRWWFETPSRSLWHQCKDPSSSTSWLWHGNQPLPLLRRGGDPIAWLYMALQMIAYRDPSIRRYAVPWWRHQMETFSAYWPLVWGIHRSLVNSPHKCQWRGAVLFDQCLNKWLRRRWFEAFIMTSL